MLKNGFIACLIALALSAFGAGNPAAAHEGHSHAEDAPAAPVAAAPRSVTASEDFEVVVAAAEGRLLVYLDRFTTNEPVVGATIELLEDGVTTPAIETAAGVYAVSGWARPPGVYSLMIGIEAGDKSDLLPVTLEIPTPVVPASTAYPIFWVVMGQTAAFGTLAFVLMVIYLRATRRYDYVLDSGVRLSDTALLLSTTFPKAIDSVRTRRLGPAMITDRLWHETGCANAIREAAEQAGFGFSVERALYATILQRMFDSEPNRPVREWLDDHVVEGTDAIVDSHVASAVEWLGRDAEDVDGEGGLRHTTKDLIERTLFNKRTDTGAGLDLVFFNTLPVPMATRQNGRKQSRKAQASPPAMAVGVVLDSSGHPVCFELWSGGSLDVEALLPAVDRLRARFDIRRVCLVSDLGIAKPATIDAFNERGIQFILGLRDTEADLRNRLLDDRRPLESMTVPNGSHERTEIAVKEVEPDETWTPGRERFIVCSETPVADAALPATEASGLASEAGQAKHYVLRTNTDLAPAEVVTRYRQLLVVEETFQAAKAILDMRTLHGAGEAIVRGHMFCSFLALLLRREIEVRLAAAGLSMNWRDVVRDLNRLAETEVIQGGRRFVLRNEASSNALAVGDALAVVLPPTIERRADDGTPAVTLEALALPTRLRSGAIRVGNAVVARAERRVREAGEWLGRQH